jgi:hypothetical protein
MEMMGASVTTMDLSPAQDWDIVPYNDSNYSDLLVQRKEHIRKLNNGFLFAYSKFNSKAKYIYGSIYDTSNIKDNFQIGTMNLVLTHLRDPFLGIHNLSKLITDTIIITEVYSKFTHPLLRIIEKVTNYRLMRIHPNASHRSPTETWWNITPNTMEEFLKIIGFNEIQRNSYPVNRGNAKSRLYTIVGKR